MQPWERQAAAEALGVMGQVTHSGHRERHPRHQGRARPRWREPSPTLRFWGSLWLQAHPSTWRRTNCRQQTIAEPQEEGGRGDGSRTRVTPLASSYCVPGTECRRRGAGTPVDSDFPRAAHVGSHRGYARFTSHKDKKSGTFTRGVGVTLPETPGTDPKQPPVT